MPTVLNQSSLLTKPLITCVAVSATVGPLEQSSVICAFQIAPNDGLDQATGGQSTRESVRAEPEVSRR